MKHTIDNRLISAGTVKVALVGCGGVGSMFLTGLARLHTALLALGHTGGLDVTAYDPDTVSESNIGRQLFSPQEVGISKAVTLITRINSYFGLGWTAKPFSFPDKKNVFGSTPHIIISCVDTRSARRAIAEYVDKENVPYWLDTGNRQADGQVVLGQSGFNRTSTKSEGKKHQPILPTITDLYREILDANIPDDNNTPSCSLAEALESQDLFIGQSIATFGLQLLWTLFKEGGLDHHGYFVNLNAGRVLPMPIDEKSWTRLIGAP